MTPREEREALEHRILAPGAAFADESRGRRTPEEACSLRTCFQRDVDRITYSKSFRRLKHKTQVFLGHVGADLGLGVGDHLGLLLILQGQLALLGKALALFHGGIQGLLALLGQVGGAGLDLLPALGKGHDHSLLYILF